MSSFAARDENPEFTPEFQASLIANGHAPFRGWSQQRARLPNPQYFSPMPAGTGPSPSPASLASSVQPTPPYVSIISLDNLKDSVSKTNDALQAAYSSSLNTPSTIDFEQSSFVYSLDREPFHSQSSGGIKPKITEIVQFEPDSSETSKHKPSRSCYHCFSKKKRVSTSGRWCTTRSRRSLRALSMIVRNSLIHPLQL